jgi:hypothetical protein
MGRKQIKELPAEVKQLAEDLRGWREQRRHGQRIPQELWNGAVSAARRHGLHQISQALKLDYYQLKRRVGGEKKGKGNGSKSEALFEELPAMVARNSEARCVVELEKGNGAKLRVSVSDAATVDWCRVKEAFLGA